VLATTPSPAANPGTITIDLNKPGDPIPAHFFGLMTEEINHSYDGGLYAELIRNRVFQDPETNFHAWSLVKSGRAAGSFEFDPNNPVNDSALKLSLKLRIDSVGADTRVGVANTGFWGIPVWPNTKYHASFYARGGDGFTGPLTVQIESNDGNTVFATANVNNITGDWKKYTVDLSTSQVPASAANRFVISASSKGTVWLSLVSLFPPTYKDRPNGNRIDIMQKLADLHPGFLRFPGGNYVEGNYIPERFDWKKTIGPLEGRPGHPCCWGYRSSDGMGLLEFLDWCEDLNMEPLLAVYAGYSLKHDYVKPGPDLQPFVQDALDEIEYCTGDVSTKWGKERAADGHPAPFVIHYVEIGNEDWFDKSRSYDGRFTQFFDAIKAKYPNIQCIATTPVKSRKPDLVDDHGYPSPAAMLKKVHTYDNRSASLPKVFFGEWATESGTPTPNLRAALCDAAWLTGLQRDSSTVIMNCYAPLFVNVNKGAWQWRTNLIGYDAASSFGSPSYYAQAIFSRNWGDVNLATDVVAQDVHAAPTQPLAGEIGLGTIRSSAEFKEIKVTSGDKTLYQSDAADHANDRAGDWSAASGTWTIADGAIQQSNETERDAREFVGDFRWTDYTLTLQARALGKGGFRVLFHAADPDNYLSLNVGGDGNVRLSRVADGGRDPLGDAASLTPEAGKWYAARVELVGNHVKCYVDDKLLITATDAIPVPPTPLFAAASRDSATGDVILKAVNVSDAPQQIEIHLDGATDVKKEADIETLTGQPHDQNTVEFPEKVAPEKGTIDDAGSVFTHIFPANSVNVIRLHAK
jgi:alpha-N-arabinofuranosidase